MPVLQEAKLEIFISENAMMKSIVLTLLLVYFIVLENRSPSISLRVNEHKLSFILSKRIPDYS
jgi:hypothetical protein